MNTFRLKIASPDGNAFEGDAVGLRLRGVEGELAILAGHAPFLTSVKPCTVRVEPADGARISGKIESGLLAVNNNVVTLLTDGFEPVDKTD